MPQRKDSIFCLARSRRVFRLNALRRSGFHNQISTGRKSYTCRFLCTVVSISSTLTFYTASFNSLWSRYNHLETTCQFLQVPLLPLAERIARLEETLQIAHQMWSGDEKPYEGKYYHLSRPLNSPQAIQKPHPPILVGGHGERKTLRLVAQYADACNFMGYLDKDSRQHKLNILREHCQALGRPYEQIEKTLVYFLHLTRDGRNGTLSPQAAIDSFADLAAEGFDQVIIVETSS